MGDTLETLRTDLDAVSAVVSTPYSPSFWRPEQ